MGDFAKCKGTNCLLRAGCNRFTAPDESEYQTYMMGPPFTEEDNVVTCKQFWFNEIGCTASDATLNLIKERIGQDHKTGYQGAGSGHLAHVSYDVISLKELNKYQDGSRLILYGYKLFIESEFSTTETTKVFVLRLDAKDEALGEKNLVTFKRDYPDELDPLDQ